MIITSQTVALRDGRACLLRSPTRRDAQPLLDFLAQTAGETSYLLREPGEVGYTLAQERDFIQTCNTAENRLMVLAEMDGTIAANASFWPVGAFARVRHRCEMGVVVRRPYWHLGVASVLLQQLFKGATACGYRQMELTAVATNARALALYEHLGFQRAGAVPNGIRYADGSCADEIIMVKQL